jgi:hypothetical protein
VPLEGTGNERTTGEIRRKSGVVIIVIITIIIIMLFITFMHGIYSYMPEQATCYGIQCCNCSVCTVRVACNVISPVKYVVYFHISTSRRVCVCAVPIWSGFGDLVQ